MEKIVVVTGAGSGFGRETARYLAGIGCTLILLGRRAAKIEAVAAELGSSAMAVACDVTSPDSVRAAFATIAGKHPRIDVLINNAGVYEPFFVRDATDAQIQASVLTNLAGPIYCTRAAIAMMDRGARIINISSETVSRNYAMFALYQSSKAGLEAFTATLHDELAADGIRVTLLRAGQMYDEDMGWTIDPAVVQRFSEENARRGINLQERPISHFKSVVGLFGTLLGLPADVNVPVIVAEGWSA